MEQSCICFIYKKKSHINFEVIDSAIVYCNSSFLHEHPIITISTYIQPSDILNSLSTKWNNTRLNYI